MLPPLSYGVAATLSAYRGVVASGSDDVRYPTAATELPLGVTTDEVKHTNQGVPVATGGIRKLYFNDTVSAGAKVSLDSNGRGIPFTDATTPNAYIGTLVGPAVASTGTLADIDINPGFKGIP